MEAKNYKVIFAYLAVCFFWGSTYLAIRIGVKDFPPFLFASVRFLIAGSIMLSFSYIKGHTFPSKVSDIVKMSIVGILLLVGGNGLVVYSEQWVPSGIASLIIATVPLFIAIIEIFILKMKKMNLIGYVGLFIGFSGVAYLAMSNKGEGTINALGVLLLVSASIFWSTGSVFSKTFKSNCSIIVNIGIQMLAGGIVLLFISSVLGEYSEINITKSSVLSIAYLIVFGSIVGYSCYIYALQNWPASRVGTYAYVNPVVAILLGNLVLNEEISPTIVISMIVILLGVVLVQRAKIDDNIKTESKIKIGILFGTFNPIHDGHINISENIRDLFVLDKVLIIPSSISPHKTGLSLEEAHHRYDMCLLACENRPKLEVSDTEIKYEGTRSKIDVLDEISTEYVGSELYYIMGSDVFISLPKWDGYKDILAKATLCVIPRNKTELELSLETEKLLIDSIGDIRICNIPFVNISSSDIRNKIASDETVEELISKEVSTYISKNHLY